MSRRNISNIIRIFQNTGYATFKYDLFFRGERSDWFNFNTIMLIEPFTPSATAFRMPLRTTVVGAFPKPAYLETPDWFRRDQDKEADKAICWDIDRFTNFQMTPGKCIEKGGTGRQSEFICYSYLHV